MNRCESCIISKIYEVSHIPRALLVRDPIKRSRGLWHISNTKVIMTILVVEDNLKLAQNIADVLEQEQYLVQIVHNAQQAKEIFQKFRFDLIILDLSLPDGDGQELCQEIRQLHSDTKILMLTARVDLDSKIEGLDGGADDYVTKPFLMDELLARIRALLRRSAPLSQTKVDIDDHLSIDTKSKIVLKNKKRIQLSPTEYRLLEYLVHHKGKVVPATEMYQHVWGDFDDELVFSNTLKVHIARLRKKIGKNVIKTVKGQGYLIS